ncbi:MAG: thioredoxin domain-containing protein, partial [Candidatus Limnocylindria bacterium]
LQRLGLLTGDEEMSRRASSIVRAVAPALERQPSAFGRMLCAADRLLGAPIDVVVAGDPRSEEARALREAASAPYVPDLVLTALGDADPHAAWPLYAGKVPRDGRSTAYACRGYACDEPTTNPEQLATQVATLASPAPTA